MSLSSFEGLAKFEQTLREVDFFYRCVQALDKCLDSGHSLSNSALAVAVGCGYNSGSKVAGALGKNKALWRALRAYRKTMTCRYPSEVAGGIRARKIKKSADKKIAMPAKRAKPALDEVRITNAAVDLYHEGRAVYPKNLALQLRIRVKELMPYLSQHPELMGEIGLRQGRSTARV